MNRLPWHLSDFDPKFLVKTQDPADAWTSLSLLTVPALTHTIARDVPDRHPCPVEALHYFKCTELFRANHIRMFFLFSMVVPEGHVQGYHL